MRTPTYPVSAIDEEEDVVDKASKDFIAGDFPIAVSDKEKKAPNATRPLPGTLPKSAGDLTSASRALLMRLLERDPKVRMRSLRQLQQSALYMGFNFEHVKSKKMSPKSILERHFPLVKASTNGSLNIVSKDFTAFDQSIISD
ncbi:unnamed protein product, partial [Iphiclides podalirius]